MATHGLLALLVLTAAVAAVLVLLYIWRGVAGMHEDDLLYLSEGDQVFQGDTERSVATQTRLDAYISALTKLAIGLATLTLLVFLVQQFIANYWNVPPPPPLTGP